jgi:4-amino-4-deoxy-L-arabinose transferase-like glycosyltransferase
VGSDALNRSPVFVRESLQRHWVTVSSVLALALVWASYADFGVTWDEGVQARYGELCLEYFRAGFEDTGYGEYLDLRFYGPVVEIGQAILYRDRPELRFDIRHLTLGVLAVGFIPILAAYARRFGRGAIAPLAVLALLMIPRLLGHATNNSKDVPFALAVSLYMAALVRIFGERKQDWPSIALGAAAAALALAVRPGGLPLLGVFFLCAWLLGRSGEAWPPDRAEWRALAARSLVFWSIAWVAMVAAWPWAHGGPIRRPIEAILQAGAFERSYPVLFAGAQLSSDALPWYYLPAQLAITVPIPLLALAILGAALETIGLRRSPDRLRAFMLGLTLTWLVLPVALVIVLRPNLYDGMRHFLFVLPAVAILAGLGAWHVATRLQATRMRALAWPVVVLLLLAPLPSILRLHPYQTSYFNALVGGLAGAAGRYDVDYWGTSLREATLFVNARAAERPNAAARTLLLGSPSPYPRTAVEYVAAPGVRVVSLADLAAHPELSVDADDYISLTRYGMDRFFAESPIVYRVERDGATLAVVRELGGLPVRALTGEPPSAPSRQSVLDDNR